MQTRYRVKTDEALGHDAPALGVPIAAFAAHVALDKTTQALFFGRAPAKQK
jgi:hypothetical protein